MSHRSKLPTATILGYPRIGRRRELKRAVESYWKGELDQQGLHAAAAQLRAATRERLVELGLPAAGGAVPESFSFYDQVLDATLALGATPARFADVAASEGATDLDLYFALARGDRDHQPLEMTKWFDTNYHYSVPEIDEHTPFVANAAALVEQLREAAAQGIESRPVLVGPVTYLLLAKASDEAAEGFSPISRLDDALSAYVALLGELASAGATWVQLDEPALVSDSLSASREEVVALVERAYAVIGAPDNRPSVLLTAPYGDSSHALLRLAALPVEAVHADLVRGTLPAGAFESGELVSAFYEKQFVAGLIDGRNIWRTDLRVASAVAQDLKVAGIDVVIGTSNSLQHVPHDVRDESKLDARLKSWLAFADQKVEQAATLARGLDEGADAIEVELADTANALADRAAAPGVRVDAVRARVAGVTDADLNRASEQERRDAQLALGIPQFATTTIGSFPRQVRFARLAHRTRGARSTMPHMTGSCEKRSSASFACRKRLASTCSCTAKPSATTWCSTSQRISTASR